MKNTEIIDETIKWNKVENRMPASAADAKYLAIVQPRGTITADELARGVKDDGCSESELDISRAMKKLESLLTAAVAQNYKVYFPFGIAGVHLTKSFPSQDAAFNPSVNEGVMGIQANAETRQALAGVKLKEDKAVAATLRGPKINSVCTGGNRFGVIVCRQPFTVAGSGLCLDPSKPTDRLTLTSDKTGAVTDVTDYTCDGEGFRIDAQVNASLTPGRHTLTAYVDMGDAAHPNVLTATHKVTAEANPAPEELAFTGAKSEGCPDGTLKPQTTVTITGTALGEIAEDDLLTFWYPTEDGEVAYPVADRAIAADGHSLTCSFGEPSVPLVAGEGRITLEPPEGGEYIASLDVRYVTE